jgi:large subunit ribosomal protein L1
MKKRSKRYKALAKSFQKDKSYSLKDAIAILKRADNTKFSSSVDIDFYLNVDPKKSDQMVRAAVVLPHGTGKKIRIAVFAKGEQEKQARASGADIVGAADLMERVSKGFLDFDCTISTPEMMRELSRLGKVLGPRGLMPSPKTGTVTNDVALAIEQIRKGKIDFKVDKQAGIHLSVGRASFSEDKLLDNISTIIEAVNEARPSTVRGRYINSLFLSSTMTPALKINL